MTLALRDAGSFHIGGTMMRTQGQAPEEYVLAAGGVPVVMDPNGCSWVGQCYVQYLLPEQEKAYVPISFWHGGSLTGVTWERTPDAREGWFTWFCRQGWAVYNTDAVERGRAGWAPRHESFRAPPFLRTAEDSFTQFRIGRRVQDLTLADLQAAAYPGCQFPLDAYAAFTRQVVPRWASTDALVLDGHLAVLDRIGPAVVVAHSQGGAFAFQAAERAPDKIAALVMIEPAQAGTTGHHTRLANIPVLVVYGDHIALDARWPTIRARTEAYLNALRDAGGDVEVLDLPRAGLTGNSHMLMMERNNLAIAELIQDWLVRKGLCR